MAWDASRPLALFLSGAINARAQSGASGVALRVSSVAATTAAMRIDGILSEAVWQSADSITSLTQVEPTQGATSSARTVIRVLATSDAIVIGVRAEYPPGVSIVSYARNRDATLDSEDHIKVVIDTYRDGRSGYVFAVNANGARYDALASGQGDSENANWDAIWDAATNTHRERMDGRDSDSHQEPAVPARAHGVGTQHSAPNSAPSGNRPLGERSPRPQGHTDESRRRADRPAAVFARMGLSIRPSVAGGAARIARARGFGIGTTRAWTSRSDSARTRWHRSPSIPISPKRRLIRDA